MNTPKYPTLLLKNTKSEIYQKTNNIKESLLNMGDYKNIYEAKSVLGVNTANEVYELLLDDWNNFVDNENKIRMNKYNKDIKKYNEDQVKKINEKAKEQAKQKKQKEEQIKLVVKEKRQKKQEEKKTKYAIKNVVKETILITAVLRLTRSRINKDGSVYYSDPILVNRTLKPITIKQSEKTDENIKKLIEDLIPEFQNTSNTIVKIKSYKIDVMDTKILQEKYKLPRSKVMMKNGFILKDDWLKYAESIAKEAYENTDGECVYHQLENFLLNPPCGNPTKFINKEKVSKKSLFNFFNFYSGDKEFDMKSGVNTEMLGELCKSIKRNMYAYDNNDKCFFNITDFDSKNYCPLTFYCCDGHFYLISDKQATKSIAESNKLTAKKIKSDLIEEKQDEDKEEIIINHIDTFNVDDAKNMEEGYYLLQQSSLNKEVISFMTLYKDKVKTKNKDNTITSFSFKNNDKKKVSVYVDSNYGKDIDYEVLKYQAEINGIEYFNEGIGSVVYKILEKDLNDLNKINEKEDEEDKEIAEAEEEEEDETDKKKVKKEENKYKLNNFISSTFNDVVNKQIINTTHFKSYQFVEKVNETPYLVNEVIDNKIEVVNKPIKKIKNQPEIDTFFNKTENKINEKNYEKIMKDIDVENKVIKLKDDLNLFKIDGNKFRRNILYYSDFEYPVYSIMDMPTTFKGEIKCGMYYVKTDNKYPFRNCGWYFEPLVKYGLDNNIITKENILYEFIPYKTLSSDYFKTHIDLLLTAFSGEKALQKIAVNALIGVWGITKQYDCKSKFSLCPYEASSWYYDENNNLNVFIKNHKIDENNVIYEGLINEEVINQTTNYCLYAMILQMEALELHKIESIVLANGGLVLDRNTDAIRYASKKQIDIKNYYWDEEQKVEKYKSEEPKELEVEKLKDFKRDDISDKLNFVLEWNIKYEKEFNTTEDIVNYIIDNKLSCHIDAMGGYGKTYLTNLIIKELEKRNSKNISSSPTNKGARLIDGKTIDTYYNKFNRNKKMLFSMLEKIEYIFIDEVSMMKEQFYTLFIMIKRSLPHLIFIISGDFGQLPPVKDSWVGDYENSAGLFSLCNGNKIYLTEYKRGDKELGKLLIDVRNGKIDVDRFKKTQETYLNIAYTHLTRKRVNNECMERYIKEHNSEFTFLKADEKNGKTQNIKLSIGMPIIAHTTNKKLNIMNSESFVIKSITDKKFTIETIGNILTDIELKHFHKFFYLGFCITLHASQGETFKVPYTIYDWGFIHFCNKAEYVAVSRATSISNIQIVRTTYKSYDYFEEGDDYFEGGDFEDFEEGNDYFEGDDEDIIVGDEELEISNICNCGLNKDNICNCKNPIFELMKLSNNFFGVCCNKWKCRCKN